ncbi:MAG: FMN-binding protein, partial [Actinobacteria bacterium]
TAGKRKVTRKITAVSVPTYPNHTDRSVYISSQALPILKSEALHAHMSANISLVSGATYTSDAFAQSLQSAILKAKRA